MDFEILKGTKDYFPEEQIKINYIIDNIKKNFERYGFRPFDTPLIEYFNILSYKYDPNAEIVQEIFKLSDRGKRDLGLRYDLTTPLCRYVASQKQMILPFRRYQIGKVFRDGPIKPGRLREFIQCDGDIIGIKGNLIESEILSLFYDVYKQLKIKVYIELNNIKILKGILLQVGFNERDLSNIILSIDKLKKIKTEGVLQELKEKKLNVDKAKEALKLLNLKQIPELQKIATNLVLKEGLNELNTLTNLLDNFKVKYKINFSMARGLDIYTGNIWEAYENNNKISSSLGSGGRYDDVIKNFTDNQKDLPAVGISFGLIPILEVIDLEKLNSNTDVLVVPLSENNFTKAMNIAQYLREQKNLNSEVYYEYKLKKAFSYAEKLNIKSIAIVGDQDPDREFTLKNIKTGTEKKETF